jgi:hypothetical protein
MAVTQSSNNGGDDFRFYAYECKHTTTFNVNAYIPFTFYGDETYHNWYTDWGGFHEGTYRGGGSMFKLVGVVEKCSTLGANGIGLTGSALYATLGADDNWKYVTHTKLGTFKTSEGDDTGDGFSLNKDLCNIGYDDNPTLIANLYINNVSISVSEGDYIRLRLYWIDVQKSFSSTDRNENDTAAPGSIRIKIGVDPVMKYTKSNQGYFELVDNSVYYKENLNVLENSLTRDIEKFRYSIVDFDLNGFDGDQNSAITDIPTIYLLNDNYSPNLPGKSSVVNHTLSNGNKKEYFYNRNSLELFFESSSTFIAKFGKISFYETDMIPFFRYTTEDSVNKNIKIPLYATASIIPNRGNVTFDSKVEKAIDFNIDYRNLSTIHTPPTTTTTSTTTTTTTVGPMYLLDASFTGNTHITTPQNTSSWFFQPTWSYGYSKFAFTSCTASGFTYSSSKNDFRYTPSGAMKGKWIIEVTGVNNALDFFSPCHVRLNSSGGTFYDQVIFHGPFTISKVITNKVYNNRVFWLEVISSNANITSARLRFLIND